MSKEGAATPPELEAQWRYQPRPAYHDEAVGPDGRVREQWRGTLEALAGMGHTQLARRWQEGKRVIHENGITYNVYGDPRSTARPWTLDPVPLVMEPGEWKRLEAAITQRARLLNTMLADLYGPQRLLREGMLPPRLIFENPNFLRPCHGIQVPGGTYIHVYSADLARSPDGQWWVIADRTQAPSGAGYALENRLVISRVLPDLFGDGQVQRLANYFQTYRDTLLKLVPSHKENPRIVLLTPGPYNETYFEHAFLARYLGYTLVEGGDLTVRDNRVLVKTLGGLLPVDVILRRQDDSFCDPLELRGDSMLGVPGLVQAVRSGNVAIANALGSGLVETAATAAFLPGLCRQLLGEELKIPSVATWWCGQQGPFDYVAEHLDNLVVKPTFSSFGQQPIFGAKLSKSERAELLEKMRARPDQYVAQEQVSLSTVPVWNEGKLLPRHMVLRVYAVACGDSYRVMPGGLTRVTSSLDSLVVSMQKGGGSKDTWVPGDDAAPHLTLLRPASHPLEISRATFDLPSRVADNLFWLGRYAERVEMAVRLVRAILPRLSEESERASSAGVETGIQILRALGYLPAEAVEESTAEARERGVLAMLYEIEGKSPLARTMEQVRQVAWLLRDRISGDAWRVLSRLGDQLTAPAPAEPLLISSAQDRLNEVVLSLSAFSGLVMEGMTRGDGWRFLDIGRRLERSIQMTEVLRYGIAESCGADAGVLEAVLDIADSSITYRSRYLTSVLPELVLDLLLVDEVNPRSIAFQFVQLGEHIDQLPESQSKIRRPQEARIALSLLTAVQLCEVHELTRPDPAGRWSTLEALLGRQLAELRALSEALTRRYFSHAVASRRLLAP